MAKAKHNGNGHVRTINDLTPDPRNIRKHSARNLKVLEQSLNQVGAARSIVIDERNQILSGNGLVEAAVNAGIERVKVVDADGDTVIAVRRSGLTKQQKQRLAFFDNYSSDTSAFDYDAEILAEIARDDELIAALAREDKAISALLSKAERQDEKVDPGELIDKAAELQKKWKVARGDIWEIGKHRLMCGDSTNKADVERLMNGKRAQMVFTDPPWNVDYQGGTKKRDALENDNIEVGWADWLTTTLKNANGHATNNCPAYVFFGLMRAGDTQLGIGAAGWRICQTLVWVKQHAQFGNFRAHYKYQHEPFYYCSIGEKVPTWYGANNEVSVWQIDRASRNDWHPTQKPPELAHRAILNSTSNDALVLDLFIGSGSTLVACEQTGRIGYGMEIEPKYCAVTLERLSNLGLKPRKVQDGGKAR